MPGIENTGIENTGMENTVMENVGYRGKAGHATS